MADYISYCGQTKVVGQTLFLGASVVSANIQLGWGNTASSAYIELVEDFQPYPACYPKNPNNGQVIPDSFPILPFTNPYSYPDNHYHECCRGFDKCPDNCYIDEYGTAYNSNRLNDQGDPNPPKEKNVPGKIYYAWDPIKGFVSRYWYQEDPGFFGTGTRVNPDGTLDDNPVNIYNLINVPVFFKFDNLTFIGIISRWERDFREGRNFYRVNIQSVNSLLSNAYMIVNGYAGSVYSRVPGDTYGSPRNYTGPGLTSIAPIRNGNIHNVFNVYGFLESLGPYGFGGSNKNTNGISYSYLIAALKILTSSQNIADLSWKSRNMFSPFGRILGKTMQKINDTSKYFTIQPAFASHSFGVIPPRLDANGIPRIEFTLDLSELNIPPDIVRYSTTDNIVEISNFLSSLLEVNGQQTFYTEGYCLVANELPYNVIKIRASAIRNTYSKPYAVDNVVRSLQNSGYAVSSSTSNQARNEASKVRTLIIGGKQQRLYQAKNYRLAFNQTSLIWDAITSSFVNYRRFDTVESNKWKIPLGLSTRNRILSVNTIGFNYTNIVDSDERLRNLLFSNNFFTTDTVWDDDLIKSRNITCIKTFRSVDFETDPNTGFPKDIEDSRPIPAISSYGVVGNYEIAYNKNGSPSIKFLDLKNPNESYSNTGSGASGNPPVIGGNQPDPQQQNDGEEKDTVRVINQATRYIPLYKDIICPFFGYKKLINFSISSDSNIHRYIRPVWLDSWTGQLAVSLDINEIPPVACGALVSLYDSTLALPTANISDVTSNTGFTPNLPAGTDSADPPTPDPLQTDDDSGLYKNSLGINALPYAGNGLLITESEMRAAMAGLESYLTYCLAKMNPTKPDLFVMLVKCWGNKGIADIPGTAELKKMYSTIGALGPGFTANIGQTGNATPQVANSAGAPGKPQSQQVSSKISKINFNYFMNAGFLEDLKIIVDFIKNIATLFYGKQYIVKLPMSLSYRDRQFSGFSIPGFGVGNIFVFSGSGKIFYNYDKADGAWEEWGNYVDNTMIVGGSHLSVLTDEAGLIPPLLGFNASDQLDYIRASWCILSVFDKAQRLNDLRNMGAQAPPLDPNWLGFNRPLDGNLLSTWKLERKVYKNSNDDFVDFDQLTPDEQEEARQNKLETDTILLDENTTEDELIKIFGPDYKTKEALANLRKFLDLKKQLIMTGLHGIECGAEVELQEDFTDFTGYPCEGGELTNEQKQENEDQQNAGGGLKWEIDKSARYAVKKTPCPTRDLEIKDYTSPSVNWKVRKSIIKVFANTNSFLIPGINFSNLDNEGKDYVIINVPPFVDAFGNSLCGGGKKLYIKSSFDEIAFGTPAKLQDARAILKINNSISIAKNSLAYHHDPNLYIMPNVAAEDISFYRYATGAGTTFKITDPKTGKMIPVGTGITLTQAEYDHLLYLENTFLTPLKTVSGVGPILLNKDRDVNVSTKHRSLAPKAIQPFFAGVPIKSNKYCYGPWTNYPDISKNLVFNHVKNSDEIVEQLTDNIFVDINEDYVPWKYGGVAFLDKAVIYEIEQKINFLTTEEGGDVKIYGPPIFTLGGYFSNDLTNAINSQKTISFESAKTVDYIYQIANVTELGFSAFGNYPIVQGISINIGNQGITTNYALGTYNPKHGIYNKERIDDMNHLNLSILDLRKKISTGSSSSIEDLRQSFFDMINNVARANMARSKERIVEQPVSMFGNSPTEVLIGKTVTTIKNPGIIGTASTEELMTKGKKQQTWAGMYKADEVVAELLSDYENKSLMSLDGIFSPVSFYPTSYNNTFSLSNFYTAHNLISNESNKAKHKCRICLGLGYIVDNFVNYATTDRVSTKQNFPCPACSRSRLSYIKDSATPEDKITRVIIDKNSSMPQINFYTLNPLVVSAGEFKNSNSQGGVNETHSIRFVARGEALPGPETSLDIFENATLNESIIGIDHQEFDYATSSAYGTDILFNLNQRFFALRGPLMLHSWGYDTDGYPVPNANDDPLEMDSYGRYKRFYLTHDGFNDMNKDGSFGLLPSEYETGQRLGDIITKNYEFKNNKWTLKENTPSRFFSKYWASRSDQWPVGPIDLRWDSERRVWTSVGGCTKEELPPFIVSNTNNIETLKEFIKNKTKNKCPYKMIYITLEEDLTRSNTSYYYSNTARAYVDDLEYQSNPLPNNYRRLVYLIDRSGYTAPKGTRLYSKYNPDIGFYEPISKPTVTAVGLIVGAQARIEQHYAQGRLANTVPVSVVSYDNPLGLSTPEGTKGIFTFINGKWTLTATNS